MLALSSETDAKQLYGTSLVRKEVRWLDRMDMTDRRRLPVMPRKDWTGAHERKLC